MKHLYGGGFSKEELDAIKQQLFMNILMGMQELVRQVLKSECQVSEVNLKKIRLFNEVSWFHVPLTRS